VASAAARARLAAEMANDAYAPNAALTMPPSDAPTTVIVPQAEPAMAFAAARSAGATTFGRAAVAAGE
jgi:hypothetical protein